MDKAEEKSVIKELAGVSQKVGEMGADLKSVGRSLDQIRESNTTEHGQLQTRLDTVEVRITKTEVNGAKRKGKEEGRRMLFKTLGRITLGIFAVIGVGSTIIGVYLAGQVVPQVASANRPAIATPRDTGPSPTPPYLPR